jgi:hypothetical protein
MPDRCRNIIALALLLSVIAAPVSARAAAWAWVAGDSLLDQHGAYGARGIPAPTNIPGSRQASPAVVWRLGAWLFGGTGFGASGSSGQLNDLWQYDSTLQQWIWVSGGTSPNAPGVYGTPGVASPTNLPGGRSSHASCAIDADAVLPPAQSDRLCVFGGSGYGIGGPSGLLNDLWMFDGTNWTWVSGTPVVNQPGVYGTLNLPEPANHPGARRGAVMWCDPGTHALWLFGGYGYGQNPALSGYLNDLWRWDGTNWAWMGGSSDVNDPGVPPSGSFAKLDAWPEGFSEMQCVFDAVWRILFGFGGRSHAGDEGGYWEEYYYDGPWEFDYGGRAPCWKIRWRANSSCPVYGSPGIPDPANGPGWRASGSMWRAGDGALWLYGGDGYDSTCAAPVPLADLWKWDGTAWAFVSGPATGPFGSDHGLPGQTASANTPGSRSGAAAWTDPVDGHMMLFGGRGYDFALAPGLFHDLWRLDGQAPSAAPQPEIIVESRLGPAAPNPAQGSAVWTLAMPRSAHVSAEVFDAMGRRVVRLADQMSTEGQMTLTWDLRDGTGRAVGSGTYILRVEVEGAVLSRTVSIMR